MLSFLVSTAWICQPTNHLRTWERNSSWLWRMHKASRASTKIDSTQTTHNLKKTKQNKKPQGLQTSCCSSYVRACCTVMPDCEPLTQHSGLRLYSDLSSQYAYIFVSLQCGLVTPKRCWGKKGSVAMSIAEILSTGVIDDWGDPPFLSPLPLSCENLQCWKTLMHFNSSFMYTLAQYSSALQWKGLSMALIWLVHALFLKETAMALWSQLSQILRPTPDYLRNASQSHFRKSATPLRRALFMLCDQKLPLQPFVE